MKDIQDINTHIANLARQTNKVIAKYAQLEMCRIKNIIVKEDGHIDYISNPEPLLKERAKYKKKMEILLEEIEQAVTEREKMIGDDEQTFNIR